MIRWCSSRIQTRCKQKNIVIFWSSNWIFGILNTNLLNVLNQIQLSQRSFQGYRDRAIVSNRYLTFPIIKKNRKNIDQTYIFRSNSMQFHAMPPYLDLLAVPTAGDSIQPLYVSAVGFAHGIWMLAVTVRNSCWPMYFLCKWNAERKRHTEKKIWATRMSYYRSSTNRHTWPFIIRSEFSVLIYRFYLCFGLKHIVLTATSTASTRCIIS